MLKEHLFERENGASSVLIKDEHYQFFRNILKIFFLLDYLEFLETSVNFSSYFFRACW